MPIEVLSEVVAAQIAAGEVVERPASVVKEVLENALDAGATHIDIEIRGAGSKLIRITDNGHGIPTAEVELALHRHATSKLRALDDLYQLHTLGFRGEALHSIASVSRLTLITRHTDEQSGTRLIVEGGKVISRQGIGAPSGTSVEVGNLFFNVPARRKFLKSEATERRHITNVVSRYALAYPDVRFRLQMENRETLHTTGSGNLADVIIATGDLDTFREMVEVQPLAPSRPDLPPIEVLGYVTTPNVDRANRNQIQLFVNGRAISDQRLTYAVVQAYHTLLPAGRYPVAVLMIEMLPEDVDVNVHPTKAEVRFRHPDAVFSAVQRAVRYAVINQSEAPTIHTEHYTSDHPADTPIPEHESSVPPRRAVGPAPERTVQFELDLETDTPGRYRQHIPEDEDDAFEPHYETPLPPHLRQRPEAASDDPTAIPDGPGTPRRPRTLPILRVVGQIGATYIVAEGPAGMYLIDQHAAHERILFEQFLAEYNTRQITTQQTLSQETLHLSPELAQLLEENLPMLHEMGFEVETIDQNAYQVIAVPAVLSDQGPAHILDQALQEIEAGDVPGQQNIEDRILRRVCKAAAVKAGQVLTHHEMQALIQQLERCENPHTCPHGRPTMVHMSNTQLESHFGRT